LERHQQKVARAKDAQGFNENKDAARIGGNVADNVRKELEEESGVRIISPENFLSEQKKLNKTKK